MSRNFFLLSGLLMISYWSLFSQKIMDENVYAQWNKIKASQISNNGSWISYELEPGYGDKTLVLYNTDNAEEIRFSSSSKGKFNEESAFFAFIKHPEMDTIRALKLKKTKKEDLPPDTLVVYNLNMGTLSKVSGVDAFSFPEKWSGCMAYQKEIEEVSPAVDTTTQKKLKAGKAKKQKKLILRNLVTEVQDTLGNAGEYVFAVNRPWLSWTISGRDSLEKEGVYAMNVFRNEIHHIFDGEGEFQKLNISEEANYITFLADRDTTKERLRSYSLFLWKNGESAASEIVEPGKLFSGHQFKLSSFRKPVFSEDESKLFFGIAPDPLFKDTTMLDEEMVQVEVWHHADGKLYTQQENQKKRDSEYTYEVLYDIADSSFVLLNDPNRPLVQIGDERNAEVAFIFNDLPYRKYMSWEGRIYRDVFIKDLENGEEKQVAKALKDNPVVSPKSKYLYWFERDSSIWKSYSVKTNKIFTLTDKKGPGFAREEHDLPAPAYPYGIAGWSDNDDKVYIYDRYDIWEVDPENRVLPKRLTYGREDRIRFRYIKLDPEARTINEDKWLMHAFDEKDKSGGYAWFKESDGATLWITKGPYQFSSSVKKARNSEMLFYTKQDFALFPDLILSNIKFEEPVTISNANPQSSEYEWGTIELVKWTSFSGKSLEGLLVKPPAFDSLRKYPVIVNFYERSSDRLHRNRAPEAHRSTINYSYYSNRGYIIFNPDVVYDIGYPGQSCYDAVISGVEMIKELPFVDSTRIGVQGHSWGGYQIAHLLTKTNVFKCAEAGAPVVNMVSAYGGIRWGSGLSRMFQYENTQSRIGGTLWEKPELYLENSPIFNIDKVQTPVLILHNDKDGAVPWYQGIEYFVALRRLGKEAWMLNYNNEPHWPLKWHNRLDFNIRMRQFFDYYLMDGSLPSWMKRGVPATEKGIRQGLDPAGKK